MEPVDKDTTLVLRLGITILAFGTALLAHFTAIMVLPFLGRVGGVVMYDALMVLSIVLALRYRRTHLFFPRVFLYFFLVGLFVGVFWNGGLFSSALQAPLGYTFCVTLEVTGIRPCFG